ncbi:hypothetical protein N1027_11710 [Herbiconiux sp. CPCC 205763]|uniref:Uncharacterized protein n=1 Tax=Herbiconiux aconitum TaxID=2970913 RepID=A0ABT2GU14_9MICO|nr:hypothetical protein [Herbiconiux aconitum]MCS5718800.1 hypothetical protein [Herbiconiux aconitum]
MDISWDESFFSHGQIEMPTYWVCFWTAVEGSSAMHDPVKVEGAESVNEVIEWIHATRGSRGYELFVEANDRVETRDSGWVDRKQFVRLAGDFRPASTVVATWLFTKDD